MMSGPEPSIRIHVDTTNPGQFFASCGLLELADRLWPGAEGWFDRSTRSFLIRDGDERANAHDLISSLIDFKVMNTMSALQVHRRSELGGLLKQLRRDIKEAEGDRTQKLEQRLQDHEKEKKALDSLWRERPIAIGSPFNLQVDWFLDEFAGGNRFKTWAGQQSVIEITRAMSSAIRQGGWDNLDPAIWLSQPSDDESVPFNFDSNLGPQASSVDVGYSLDALKISTRTRPLIELGAFIGLQRFRPFPLDGENRYRYRAWHTPLCVNVASIAATTVLPIPDSSDFEFRLLYRTKYLKSFLPATQVGATT